MHSDLYEIQVLDSLEYNVIVYSRAANTISDYIKEVAGQLVSRNCTGLVLFDLLLSNGINDRYYILNFNGSQFEYKTLRKLDIISNKIFDTSNNYYRNNISLLESSILTPKQKRSYLQWLLANK